MVGTSRVAKLAGVVVAALLAASCAGSSPEVPTGADGQVDPVLVTGRDIYGKRCAACHGAEGQGASGSRFDNGQAVAAFPNAADMEAIIAEGDGGSMPAFADSLSGEEITAVTRYVREVLNEL